MHRAFGILATFTGWVALLAAAIGGLISSQLADPGFGEAALSSVYGVDEITVLCIFLGAALVALFPIGAALVSDEGIRLLYAVAAATAIAALLLLPDELGRVHSFLLFPAAAAFAAGGYLLDKDRLARTAAAATAGAAGVRAPGMPAPAAQAESAGPAQPDAAPAGRAPKRSRAQRVKAGLCPWCSAKHRAGAATCPSCGAALVSSPEIAEEAIPGVTAVSPELRVYEYRRAQMATKRRTGILTAMMGNDDEALLDAVTDPAFDAPADALAPPSEQVRLEMARLDKEIAAAHEAAVREAAEHERLARAAEAEPPQTPHNAA